MPVFKQNEIFAGRYLLDQLIGEGGFSEVWKANDLMADSAVVAVKIYAPGKGLDDYGLRQFRNEFSLTYNLSHPNLLKVNHFDVADGSPYLTMTYCPFGSLAHVLRDEGIFSERQVALVLCQVASALDEIHCQDPPIIHQDIKPDNILLLQPEVFMLADFGISSRIRHTLTRKESDLQALTIAYAPPERFDRHPESDASSDIFSLGVTLYEMCTNTVPWEGAGGQCLLKGASIPALPAPYSPELNEILEACMSVDRTKRPTAADIHLWARHYLETGKWLLPKKAKKVLPIRTALVSPRAAAAMVLIAVAGFGFYQVQHNRIEEKSQVAMTPAVIQEKGALAKDKITSPLADQKNTKGTVLPKSNQRLRQQDSNMQALGQRREAWPVRTNEAQVKKTDVVAVTQRSTKSHTKAKPAISGKPKQSKKPLFKTNTKAKNSKSKKAKSQKKWLKKLKRRLSL